LKMVAPDRKWRKYARRAVTEASPRCHQPSV
jgi:hypothetical protein